MFINFILVLLSISFLALFLCGWDMLIIIWIKDTYWSICGIVILIRIAFLTPNLEKQYIFVIECHIYHTRSAIFIL